jgi:LCP family protein required for cell wall assembly
MAQHHHPRRHRSWGQRLTLVGGALSAVLLAAAAGGLGYFYRKVERLPRIELSGVLASPEASGDPQNYLIVGVDDADTLAADDPVRVGRDSPGLADTIMVLRIDPAERQASLLSLPRDLWVPYGGGDEARINTAIQRGNGRPDVLVQVLDDYLGIPIHHYVQLDFAGFYGLVEAIDGVPIYFPNPARDRNSGLSVLETGCVTLDARQALEYARSRHYQELIDDEWTSDPTGDLGRIQRQQAFIRAALNRAVSRGARNPGTFDRLLDVALDSVTVDDELTTGDIFDLAQRFRSFNPSSLETVSVPVVEDTTSGGAQIVRLVESEAEAVLAQFRGSAGDADSGEGDAGDAGNAGDAGDGTGGSDGSDGGGSDAASAVAPASVRLSVLNGSGVSGQASDASAELSEAGFSVIGTGEAETFDYSRTTVRYPAGSRTQAEAVASWLVAGADLEEVPASDGTTDADAVTVITGADWQGVADEAGTVDTTTSTLDTGGDDDTGDATSSTVPEDDGTTTTTTAPLQTC